MTTKDLVAEMLPTLCEKFMGVNVHDRDLRQSPAQEARQLFDALEALQQEHCMICRRGIDARGKTCEGAPY